MKVVGIDPGLSGAIAVLDVKNGLLAVHDMPVMEVKVGSSMKRKINPALLTEMLRPMKPEHIYIERVAAMPGQGVTSIFNFGYGFGLVIGVVSAIGYPHSLVGPRVWQAAVGSVSGKDGNRSRACELYPKSAGFFSRKKDDGRADATLIAHYGALSSYVKKISD